eukprot:IDg8966t1
MRDRGRTKITCALLVRSSSCAARLLRSILHDIFVHANCATYNKNRKTLEVMDFNLVIGTELRPVKLEVVIKEELAGDFCITNARCLVRRAARDISKRVSAAAEKKSESQLSLDCAAAVVLRSAYEVQTSIGERILSEDGGAGSGADSLCDGASCDHGRETLHGAAIKWRCAMPCAAECSSTCATVTDTKLISRGPHSNEIESL